MTVWPEVTATGAWLRCLTPRPGARRRLICLPYAGGGSGAFRRWGTALPADVEVWAADLPGHAGRLGEPLIADFPTLAEGLTGAILEMPPLPLALFGHSMGALLAAAVGHRLRERGREPFLIVAAGHAAPGASSLDGHRISDLDDASFLRELQRRYDGIPPEIAGNDEIMELMLPILRADLRVVESAASDGPPSLTCPLLVFAGTRDPATPRPALDAWSGLTTAGPSGIRYFEGGHFFIESQRPAVIDAIAAALGRA